LHASAHSRKPPLVALACPSTSAGPDPARQRRSVRQLPAPPPALGPHDNPCRQPTLPRLPRSRHTRLRPWVGESAPQSPRPLTARSLESTRSEEHTSELQS